jgi:small subunit ribosomal protein S8e
MKGDCVAVWHGERGKKKTGGKIKVARKKKKRELGSLPLHTKLGPEKRKMVRTKGGNFKIKLSKAEFANVVDPSTKTAKKVKILDVVDNKASPQFVRSKIITKGAVIKTELGLARVTSVPSQHGIVNAVLTKEKI